MGSQDEQTTDIANSIINQSLQNVANFCSISCNDNIDNLDVVIVGGNDTININQSCTIIGAECMIKSVISSQIENMVQDILNQKESNAGIFSLFGPSSSESTNITNSIKNQVSQLISNTCVISSDSNTTNVAVFAQDANLNLNIAQSGSLNHAECAIDTVAKMIIDNKIKNDVTQSESSCGNILGILIVGVIILILVFIGPYLSDAAQIIGGFIEPNCSVC
jgi:hypothetical protein